jgi:hypothetical protein
VTRAAPVRRADRPFAGWSIKKATRDGAPPIDLIDGDILCELLK